MKNSIKYGTYYRTTKLNLLKTIYLKEKTRYYYDRTKQGFFCDTQRYSDTQ